MGRAFLLIEVKGVHTHTHTKKPTEHLENMNWWMKPMSSNGYQEGFVFWGMNVSAWHFLLKQSTQNTSLFDFLKDYSILARSTREYIIYIYIVYSCSHPSCTTSTTAGNIHLHQRFFVWSRKKAFQKTAQWPEALQLHHSMQRRKPGLQRHGWSTNPPLLRETNG